MMTYKDFQNSAIDEIVDVAEDHKWVTPEKIYVLERSTDLWLYNGEHSIKIVIAHTDDDVMCDNADFYIVHDNYPFGDTSYVQDIINFFESWDDMDEETKDKYYSGD